MTVFGGVFYVTVTCSVLALVQSHTNACDMLHATRFSKRQTFLAILTSPVDSTHAQQVKVSLHLIQCRKHAYEALARSFSLTVSRTMDSSHGPSNFKHL